MINFFHKKIGSDIYINDAFLSANGIDEEQIKSILRDPTILKLENFTNHKYGPWIKYESIGQDLLNSLYLPSSQSEFNTQIRQIEKLEM